MLRTYPSHAELQTLDDSAHSGAGVLDLGILLRPHGVVLVSFIYMFDGIAKAYRRL